MTVMSCHVHVMLFYVMYKVLDPQKLNKTLQYSVHYRNTDGEAGATNQSDHREENTHTVMMKHNVMNKI